MDAIEELLVAEGIGHVRVDGRTTQVKKNEMIMRFQQDEKVSALCSALCVLVCFSC